MRVKDQSEAALALFAVHCLTCSRENPVSFTDRKVADTGLSQLTRGWNPLYKGPAGEATVVQDLASCDVALKGSVSTGTQPFSNSRELP